jgi:hypothetical protein
MKNEMKSNIVKFRRSILKSVIPEFFWKRFIELDGAKIPVRGMPYSYGVKRILSNGEYEVSERILIKEIIKEGDHIIEFGGSIGIVTAIMGSYVKESGFIISVEASHRLTNSSKLWLEPKGNIKILSGIGFPVYEVPEKYKNIEFNDDGNSLGGKVDFRLIDSNLKSKKYKHDIFDLKSIIKAFDIIPTILVIDIEGSEIVYLEDNISIPSSIKHIVIEMHPNFYGDTIEKEIIDRLISLGYCNVKEISHVYLLSQQN